MAFIKVARNAYHMCLRNQDLTIQCLYYRGLTSKELCDVRNNLQWNKVRNHKPAALKAGIIVAANANQKAPLKIQESVKNLETKKKNTGLTDSSKDNTGKSVTKDEFQDTSNNQQHATKESNRATS